MRVLILGSNGMAGHMVSSYLSTLPRYKIINASRTSAIEELRFDATIPETVENLLTFSKPDVIVNCVGLLVKQSNNNPLRAALTNSVFPHLLAEHTKKKGLRLIHISTDCVFSGNSGPYVEIDLTDALDIYGKSKAIGEVIDENNLTIRTSIIGPEISDHATGLFDWFMHEVEDVNGFARVIWSGVTTLELSKAIDFVIADNPISGLLHLTNNIGLSKYILLKLIKKIWGIKRGKIREEINPRQNKALVTARRDFDYDVPPYAAMLQDLKNWMISHPKQYSHYF